MAGVDIGPFQNIVGVGWGSASIRATVVDFGPTFRYVEFQEVDELGDPVDNDGTTFQGLLTGVTSGASVDFSLIPVTNNFGPSTLYVAAPSCIWAPAGFYNLTTGNTSTSGEAPTLPGYIENAPGFTSAARVWSIPSGSLDSGSPPACQVDNNGPALPGFISGEDVTVVKPPPEE